MQRFFLFLFLFMLEACQSKSEIDKCVAAQLSSLCFDIHKTADSESSSFKDCIQQHSVIDDGRFRLQCLRAQAGKN
jgi:hypothetical protein